MELINRKSRKNTHAAVTVDAKGLRQRHAG